MILSNKKDEIEVISCDNYKIKMNKMLLINKSKVIKALYENYISGKEYNLNNIIYGSDDDDDDDHSLKSTSTYISSIKSNIRNKVTPLRLQRSTFKGYSQFLKNDTPSDFNSDQTQNMAAGSDHLVNKKSLPGLQIKLPSIYSNKTDNSLFYQNNKNSDGQIIKYYKNKLWLSEDSKILEMWFEIVKSSNVTIILKHVSLLENLIRCVVKYKDDGSLDLIQNFLMDLTDDSNVLRNLIISKRNGLGQLYQFSLDSLKPHHLLNLTNDQLALIGYRDLNYLLNSGTMSNLLNSFVSILFF